MFNNEALTADQEPSSFESMDGTQTLHHANLEKATSFKYEKPQEHIVSMEEQRKAGVLG